MGTTVSNPFRLQVVAQTPDNTVWLGGNGNWGDGANPGAPTWNALKAIVAAINPTTGGWAQVPNTSCDPPGGPTILYRRKGTQTWPIGTVEGSNAAWTVWATSAWDGRSFVKGVCGQHTTYNGIELYRIRLTDPPAAIRMYDPPTPAGTFLSRYQYDGAEINHGTGNFKWRSVQEIVDHNIRPLGPDGRVGPRPPDLIPPWGPMPSHHYDCWHHDAATGKFLFVPDNSSDCNTIARYLQTSTELIGITRSKRFAAVMLLDLNAPTPKRAWEGVNAYGVLPTNVNFTFQSPIRNSDGNWVVWTQLGGAGTTATTLNIATKTLTLGSTADSPHGRMKDQVVRRRTASGRQFIVGGYALPSVTLFERGSGVSQTLATFPTALAGGGSAMGTSMPGLAIVGEKATIWGRNDMVGYYDGASGASALFTGRGPPEVPWNGTYGSWVAVPQAGCFAGITNDVSHNVWVFRPPAAWGIFPPGRSTG